MAPPPEPLLPLLPVAAATGMPRAIGLDVTLPLLLLLLLLQDLKTASCRGPSHHILPGVFQSCRPHHPAREYSTVPGYRNVYNSFTVTVPQGDQKLPCGLLGYDVSLAAHRRRFVHSGSGTWQPTPTLVGGGPTDKPPHRCRQHHDVVRTAQSSLLVTPGPGAGCWSASP
jgi:hypothetical protein